MFRVPAVMGVVLALGFHAEVRCVERPSSIEELREAIQERVEKSRRGAVGVALVSRDRVIWAAGIGVADPDTGRLADENTYWRVGSISKSFVGIAALVLSERNKLRLTDKVVEWVPEVPIRNKWERADPLRIAHLLEHTAGLDDLRAKDYASNDSTPLTLLQGLDHVKESLHCRWPPGRHMSYSNAGPAVAAYIVQKADGRLFEDFVAEEILEPLGMAAAGFLLNDRIEARLAVAHDRSGQRVPYSHIVVRPSGALNATPVQMANLVRMLLNRGELDGRRILSPQSIERIERTETTLAAASGLNHGYGLGNYSRASGGFVFRGHNGGMTGYRAEYGYLPEQGLGYCVMASGPDESLRSRVRDLVRAYLVSDLRRPDKPGIVRLPADIDDWTGYYRPVTSRSESRYCLERFDIRSVSQASDHLVVRELGRSVRFYPTGRRVFKRRQSPMTSLALVEGPDGRRYAQGELGNLGKVSSAAVWFEIVVASLALLLIASSPLWAVVWIPRKLAGRLRGCPVTVRAWPLAAIIGLPTALLVAGGVAESDASAQELIEMLARPSLLSVSVLVLPWAFVLLSITGLVFALRSDSHQVGRFARWHAVAVCAACLVVAIYFLLYRAIGFPSWT